MLEGKVTLQGMYLLNNNVLDGITPSFCDKDFLKRYIYYRCMDRPLLLDNPYYLQDSIALWWESHKESFEIIWNTLHEEYDPLHNYDGHEEESFDLHVSGEFHNVNSVSSFDNDSMKDSDKNKGDNASHSFQKHILDKGGNLGATMTQQMLESEIDVRLKENFYNLISDSFNHEFTYYFWE